MRLITEAHHQLDRLREAWGWLQLVLAPGPESSAHRPYSDAGAEALSARAMEAATYREIALAHKQSALAPAPAPLRLDVLDAQESVRRMVLEVVADVAQYHREEPAGPGTRRVATVDTALAYLEGARDRAVLVVDPVGVCWRMDRISEIGAEGVLALIGQDLAAAAELARRASRVTEGTVLQLEHRCPACGRRSLQLECDGADQRQWHVCCVSASCLCKGSECGCLQPVREAFQPHVWSRSELGGSFGLSAAIEAASRRARRRRGRLSSSAGGHGGWPERRTLVDPQEDT